MAIRHRIGTLLIAIAMTAVLLGFLAPRLRSWDREIRGAVLVLMLASGLFLGCMSPVGIALLLRRRRVRLGLEIRPIDRGSPFMAFILGLIMFGFAFGLLLVEARS